MEPVYSPVIAGVVSMYRVMGWKVSIIGAEHIPAAGGGVIASNHIGYLDFTFVGYGARPKKRLVRFMAKKEVFDHPISGPLMRGMKHVPVDRFGRAGDSLKAAKAALERGELIGMFPEGTISRSFVPAEGKNGAALMAMEAGVPLIPAAVWGSQRIFTKGRPKNWQRGVVITVQYGEPIPYDPDESASAVTARLMAAIGALTDTLQRTYPQTPDGPDDRWWQPTHLGGTAPTVEESARMAAEEQAARKAKRQREREEERQERQERGEG
jgi:1-acyl-sn-glycerol-3-phosphate acyltransferase